MWVRQWNVALQQCSWSCVYDSLAFLSLLYDHSSCYCMCPHESPCLCSSPLWATSLCSSPPSTACCLAGSEPLRRKPTVSTCPPTSWWRWPCRCASYWGRCWCCSPAWHVSSTGYAKAWTAISTGASAWSPWARLPTCHLRESPSCDRCRTELSAPQLP